MKDRFSGMSTVIVYLVEDLRYSCNVHCVLFYDTKWNVKGFCCSCQRGLFAHFFIEIINNLESDDVVNKFFILDLN